MFFPESTQMNTVKDGDGFYVSYTPYTSDYGMSRLHWFSHLKTEWKISMY